MEIFIGYNSKSKAYKIYDVNANKFVIARGVKMVENTTWDWENASATWPEQIQHYELENAENIDDQPIKGTRSSTDIYNSCNMAEAEQLKLKKP